VPNYVADTGVCYGSKQNRALETFDCDREIAGRNRLCYCQKAASCSSRDGSGPSNSYPCDCAANSAAPNICTKGQICTGTASASNCANAPGWRLGSAGDSCTGTCASVGDGLACQADKLSAFNGEIDTVGKFEAILAALPRLSGASEYTPTCANYISDWSDAPDVPNIVATSRDNLVAKTYDCYASQPARERSTFECASSVPGRQRLCYCDYEAHGSSVGYRQKVKPAASLQVRERADWDTTIRVLITSGKVSELAKYFSPTVSAEQVVPALEDFWSCNGGESSERNPFYAMKLRGVRDFAKQCEDHDSTDFAALTNAQRDGIFTCSLENYGVGSFAVQILANKVWDILGDWNLQLEVGSLRRSKLDGQFLALLPPSYRDALPASFPDLTHYSDAKSFFSAGNFVEAWASRAAATLRGHFFQCASYHGEQAAEIAGDCFQLLHAGREDFCKVYATSDSRTSARSTSASLQEALRDSKKAYAKAHEVFRGRPELEKKDASSKTADGAALVGSALAELDSTLRKVNHGKAAITEQYEEAMGTLNRADRAVQAERMALKRNFNKALADNQGTADGITVKLESDGAAVGDLLMQNRESIEQANNKIVELNNIQKNTEKMAERLTAASDKKLGTGAAKLSMGTYEAQDVANM